MTSKPNIVSDISTLTKIPNKVLEALVEKINLCIGSNIHDAIKASESELALNIGIGTLSINLKDMQCKFIPSKDLKSTIKSCITTGVDPVELVLEQELADKLIAICSEVL